MATISKLSASLTLNSQAFEARLRSARKRLGSFGGSIARASKRVAQFGAATAAAAAAGLALMVRSSFASIDSTAKMADVLGLTIDQLRGYQLAAQLAGVENAALETGFRRLQKNISDARLGLTTAVRAFDALGLSADALDRLSPDEQFKAVADALGNVGSQADRTRVAQDLLGRSGVQLIKLLEAGSAGIAAVQQRSRQLRGELTRIDASKIEAANDAWSEMKTVITGVADQLAVKAAPSIQWFASTVANNSASINLFFRNLTDELTRSDSLMGSVVQKTKELIGITASGSKNELVAQLTDVENQIAAQEDTIFSRSWTRSRVSNLRQLREQARDLRREIQSIELSQSFGKTRTGRRAAQVEIPTFAQLSQQMGAGGAIDAADAQDDLADAIGDVGKEIEQTLPPLEDYADITDSLVDSTWDLIDARNALKGMGREVGRFESLTTIDPSSGITNPNAGLEGAPRFDTATTNRLNAATLLGAYGTNPDKPLEGENATALLGAIKNLLQKNTMRAAYA